VGNTAVHATEYEGSAAPLTRAELQTVLTACPRDHFATSPRAFADGQGSPAVFASALRSGRRWQRPGLVIAACVDAQRFPPGCAQVIPLGWPVCCFTGFPPWVSRAVARQRCLVACGDGSWVRS
jgi:hypothetical protein